MSKTTLRASASALILLGLVSTLPAMADDAAPGEGPNDEKAVIVLGKRVIRESAGATGLDLSLRETPQSVTVVTAQQMKEFDLTDANQLLATLPGINVEASETDRTYYNSRGFDIVNFQVDGVGQPLDWGLQTGALDVAIFDRIEAVRGANGMMTGIGNPSATINYIRKRPTKDFRANASVGYGSWDNLRLSGDVSGPLNADGTVSGRFVFARTDTDSYLDYYSVERNVFYGVVSWDIAPNLNATAGYSKQDNLADGVNWGALPLTYSDGTQIDYDVSATTGAPWTFWDTHTDTAFAEMSYEFASGWTVKGVYTHKDFDDEAKLLYAFGNPDPVTGAGVTAMTGYYPSTLKQDMFDFIANGNVSLFGREHQLVLGFNTSKSKSHKWEAFAPFDVYPSILDGVIVYPNQPAYPDTYLAEEIDDRLTRAYAAAHLNLTDRLKGIVGFNAIDLETEGYSYAVDNSRSEQKVSPYAGVVYDINPNVSLYASYTDIFNPQSETDVAFARLPSAEGKSYEAGIKSEWFERRLYATASVFKSEQYGLAEWAGYMQNTDPSAPGYNSDPTLVGKSYYAGIDTYVEGYEFEVAGKVTPQWTINGGWTSLSIEDKAGNNVRNYLPRQTFKLSTTYAMPERRDLRLGASIRWQSDIETIDVATTVKQEAYAVLDLVASFRLTDKVRAALNIKNAFDETYWNGLKWSQAFYAPPRSAMVTLTYDF
ncbi:MULTISPECIES: TonB-dependent siderophore receptor [Asticcacaulis]|uniref:TonB-dependent siderophore receptor n=1 Tax=Asticcacaulis TaxID=76890 RepID=UPI001AE4EA56|nr:MULTISPECIES: TonB-dependent siderophore receptor [Asticcacaulis]MBP2161126.1 outer membrane receptor for ferric coprogen and ferric-rhodotorulic acid [Asticcacaulis solisilvae]MDR6802171.1 outer membrane receptor for ferric coprogen and ferric-rhodotorulic acid [Asticcacaulis sp. BE141]